MAKETIICEACGGNVFLHNYKIHKDSKTCKRKQEGKLGFILPEFIRVEGDVYICEICNKSFSKMGIGSHVWRKHGDGINFNNCNAGFRDGSRVIWNKGLTKSTSESVSKYASTLKNGYDTGRITPSFINKTHSDETKAKLSDIAISRGLGGVKQSKKINFDGYQLGSTYELRLAKILNEIGVRWETCKKFNYVDNFGKKRTYTPDIFVPEYNIYFDPKNDFLIHNINPSLGFSDVDKINWASEQNNIRVIILSEDQLTKEFIQALLV